MDLLLPTRLRLTFTPRRIRIARITSHLAEPPATNDEVEPP